MYHYITTLIMLTVLGILYNRFKDKVYRESIKDDYELVRKYLLNEDAITQGKPIIWIHIDYELNARKWLNFGSRNTMELNENYKYITLQSILTQAQGDFNVCLINDDSFSKLLPGWSVDLQKVASPIKMHLRELAMMKLLYYYGGMRLPISYLALKPLSGLYETGLETNDVCIGEFVNRNITSENTMFFPSHLLMACKKQSKIIKEIMLYLEELNSKDFTSEQDFLGLLDRKCYSYVLNGSMDLLDGCLLGTKMEDGSPVYVDHLLESSYIDFASQLQGIYIPDKEILKRSKYAWFPRMSAEQLYSSNIILGKYLLVSNS